MGGLRADLEPPPSVGGKLLDSSDADETDRVVEIAAQDGVLLGRRRPEYRRPDAACVPRLTFGGDERNEEDAAQLRAHPRAFPLLRVGVRERERADVRRLDRHAAEIDWDRLKLDAELGEVANLARASRGPERKLEDGSRRAFRPQGVAGRRHAKRLSDVSYR